MAARRPAESPARGLGPFIVKTQDLEKLGELGRGAFGVVVGGKLKIAAKTFHMLIDPSTYGVVPGSVHFRNFIKEFFDEASMLVSLRHVNVIRVYGVSYDAAGIPWMLLELADMPLDTYLNRRKLSSGITLDEFVVMWFQIACGLRYLHGHKPLPIIHRDIKPDNIMVVLSIDGDVVSVTYKVSDVGRAHIADASGMVDRDTAGCPLYIAPEIPAGAGFTGTADVYSLGVSVAELCQEFLNVPRKTRRAVPDVNDEMKKPGGPRIVAEKGVAWLKGVSVPLSKVLASCCDPKPTSRMTSAVLVDSLRELYPALLTPLLPPPDDVTVAAAEEKARSAAETAWDAEKRRADIEKARADTEAAAKVAEKTRADREKARADAEAAAKVRSEELLRTAQANIEQLEQQVASLRGEPYAQPSSQQQPSLIARVWNGVFGGGASSPPPTRPPTRKRERESPPAEEPAPAVPSGGGAGASSVPARPPTSLADINGAHVRTLEISTKEKNRGLAISPDGTRLVVSNELVHNVRVYALPGGASLKVFGGEGSAPGQFRNPQKMCFAPNDNARVFIVDRWNKRVQEMTLAGVHVKTIGEGIIDVDAAGIAASSRAIAVGTQFKVFLFDITSGEAIRSFGEEGLAEGKLKRCSGLRFTPDGNHILIAEWLNDRLSLFTFAGVFVRCIGSGTLKSPYDVDFAPNGNLLVADRDNHRICVFAPDGFTLLRCFGGDGATAGQFRYPTALALHASQLYVLDRDSGRVQVFN